MRKFLFVMLAATFVSAAAHAQSSVRLYGNVRSKKTGETIPRASIAILGSRRGAIANSEGGYTLMLDAGVSYHLKITSLGYKPDTISVSIAVDTKRDILLDESPATLDEIVVTSDASRVEARRIMHEVIRRKQLWRAKLLNYSCTAYSRWNLRTISGKDTTVRSVVESDANGYWDKEKGLYERITSRRQTANFPAEANEFSMGDILNFYDNRIDLDDFSLVTPVADDAFGSYDYDLIGTGTVNGASVWKIKLYPGVASTAFDGTLLIDQTDYTIAYLDLTPSGAVKIGPAKDIRLQQTFDLFSDTFWMPTNLQSQFTLKFDLPFVPAFKIELISFIKEYNINTTIADSFFTLPRHRVLAGADSIDTLKWDRARPIPLASDENVAYKRIDSTVAAIKNSDTSGGATFDPVSLLSLLNGTYNQVEAVHLGIGHTFKPFDLWPLSLSGDLGYGFRDKVWKYDVGIKQGLAWVTSKQSVFTASLNGDFIGKYKDVQDVWLWLTADYFNTLGQRGHNYSNLETSITSLIYKQDYQQFYMQRGFTLGLSASPIAGFTADLNYTNSFIWDAGNLHLVNDTGANPKHRSAVADLDLREVTTFGGITADLSGNLHTSSSALGSSYTYTTATLGLLATKRLGGWGMMNLSAEYQASLAGALPAWELLYFETCDKFFSKFNYFRGLSPFEFEGDRLWSVIAEQNFYDLPTRALGLHFMDPLNLHWRLHAGIGAADITRSSTAAAPTTNGKPYSEIGFGIGNIYSIITLDATWRLTHRTGSDFYPSVVIAFAF